MGLSKDEIDRRVRESAHFAGLTDDLLEKSPFALSGGQKRRVAIAGVIAMEPEVLVLDEPSAGLDPQGREELLSNIREFHRARGTTVVLVSHSMEEIVATLDKCYASRNGKPKCIYAHTVKGKGVSFMENQCGWHGVAPNDEQYKQAMAELKAQLVH